MRGFIAWRRDSAASYVISYAAQLVNFRLVEQRENPGHSEEPEEIAKIARTAKDRRN